MITPVKYAVESRGCRLLLLIYMVDVSQALHIHSLTCPLSSIANNCKSAFLPPWEAITRWIWIFEITAFGDKYPEMMVHCLSCVDPHWMDWTDGQDGSGELDG